ncbi:MULTISPECIES: DNA topoisomerase (ATP-hydrolyzing) subunit B [unclassified Hydrogenobaculum]|uniref:DNA topoisomerase (ATP-hydrolyzing) subunit B n=1 Tax=unclassified Hydrogenobaculum TaxID=2622382 RepID=UPI0001C527F6|nr:MULTISPECIES: DNA topoisomerase (ATP-hydrolyzing) subunit B [unclassified Hydrogenobaculum]AEF19968.1 DNA gyrase, B subunit [Hydrogenobaculum sp. 3684]AEG47253.1 DNA gyrase, B subunit [Hydrogenobaculum sp. SHO]AGG15901.1 DNA gyrase, B subunit [Hydrogenobaculum sp. HO]AGH94201.1 DNA gyrase, B subunit [Hydrogenobaculum sp. SN]
MQEYGADAIKVVTGLEHVRLRPSMYIGDISERGLHHLIWEIVDNSVDEAMAGYATHIRVHIHQDDSVTVEDNGRGIPVYIHKDVGKPAVEVVLTVLGAGGKFDKKAYQYSGGLHGVGASVVNALSEWLIVEVYRDGKIYRQEYERGVPKTELQIMGDTTKRGTKITFKPDAEIFETTKIKFDIVEKRIRELAYLNKNVTFEIIDDRLNKHLVYKFEKGIIELVEYLAEGKEPLFDDVIYIESGKDGTLVEIAFKYTKDYKESLESFVNNIKTIEGGTHVTGFRSGLSKVVSKLSQNIKISKELKEMFTGEDLREGLVAVVSCKVPEPQFEGQTKTKLGNQETKNIVESITVEFLTDYFEKHQDILKLIVEKAIEAALAREAAKKAKDLVRRKSFLEDTSLPGKLADCSEKDPSKCEIFIVEGESAGGSAKQGRDRRFQAILPLKGKILNVEKARIDKALSNEEIRAIISALGCNIGEDIDLSALRYHKTIIMTDADVDGSHIRTLLLTFFYRFMTKLIENGHVYIAQPPLYKVKIGKKETYIKDDKELEKFLLNIIRTDLSITDAKSNTYRGDVLINMLNTIKEQHNTIAQILNKRNKDVITYLLSNKIDESYLKDEQKAKKLLEDIQSMKSVSSAKLKYDDFDGSYSIVIYDIYQNFSIIDIDFLTSGTYKKLFEEHKEFFNYPISLKLGHKVKNIEKPVEDLYQDIINFVKDGIEIQRYKGLGEMNPEQLWETTMNPNTRRLLRVSLEDAAEADRIFSILMGENVEPRREFIETYAKEVRNLDV